MSEPKKCTSCGSVADFAMATTFIALTAKGEMLIDKMNQYQVNDKNLFACASCLIRAGQAMVDGDFAE